MSEHTEQLAALGDRKSLQRPSHRDESVIHTVRGVGGGGGGGGDPTQQLRVYWEILRKRRWTVLTVAFVVSTVVALVSFKTKPVYEATARVEIEAETPEVQSLSALFQSTANSVEDSFLQTQVRVLQSDNLAWHTIQELGLAQNAEFALPPSREARGTAASPTALQTRLTQAFKSHLRVQLIRDTRMLEISFQGQDPQLAARVANALVGNYAEYNFHKKYDATRQASGWMEQQLDELKAKVEKSQQALVDYERQHAIVSTSDKQNVVEQRLGELSKDLTEALSARVQKESLYELVKSDEAQVAFVTQDELLQRLEEKFADLRGSYVDALAQYGPNYPKVVRLRDQVNEIQSLIDRQRKRIVTRIRDDYTAAVHREKLLTAVVAQQKVEVGALNQLLIQHNMLKREFDTSQQLYDNLLQRLKDATVSAGLRATNIHQVDTALPPTVPIRPQKTRDTLVGLLVGVILGVTVAFVKEGLDNSIKSADDVERLTAAPVLAIIPASYSLGLAKSWLGLRRENKEVEAIQVELAVVREPGSALAEAYRALRTSVLLSTAPHPPQVLLITSSQPGEGKTVTTMNLALAMAQRGGKVIVVDADLRKASVGAALGLDERKGLSSLLTGAHTLDEVVQQVEAVPNLWALPAGPRPPNPAELLSSTAMEKVLSDLRGRYDHIVMDSPPLLLVTDATVLSNLVDGVMLVVENEGATRGALARSRRILEGANARILGTILNKVDLRRDGYYGQYYRRYYYYYR
jgi:capsular exopolysaccharide synthesis family protein